MSPGRRGSPPRYVEENVDHVLDPEINRALARELYVDSTVHVVGGGKKKGKGVKPGQMNLFHPKGAAALQYKVDSSAYEEFAAGNLSPSRGKTAIDQIHGIFMDDGGQGTIRNDELRQKTENVQKEFEQLMGEMVARRSTGMGLAQGAMPRMDDILDGYYAPGPERKHKSPTKRLIKHKDSTWAHKKRIQSGIAKGEYSQTYCISPGKSYVIEAQGGELPYEMAQSSPSKFYS